MAASTRFLNEEQFLCPICLDIFTHPVSTPCGHNFCRACLTTYWNDAPVCQCPMCKEVFERKPDLRVNTFISEFTSQFKLLQVTDALTWSSEQQAAGPGDPVLCDVCTDTQQEAVKTCLECLTSYCNTHLERHHRVTRLKSHTLVVPLASLEDKICKVHSRPFMLFCRKDKVLLCDICASSRHASHDFVPVQRAYDEMKALLGEAEVKAEEMINERQQKVSALKKSVTESQTETKDVIANDVTELTTLVSEIQKSQVELVKMMEERQQAAEEQAAAFISSVETDISHLRTTKVKLAELKQTKDQLCFLQNFLDPSFLPNTMDLSTFRFNRHVEIHHIRQTLSTSVSQLRMLLHEMNQNLTKFSDGTNVSSDAMLPYMQQYEEDVVLDPDTAHPLLIISADRKQVRYSMGSGLWGNQLMNPRTFTEHLAVLGQRGFSSQRFYFEVFVGRKSEWCLGVATASIQRNGSLCRSSQSGLWAIWFLVDKFETFSCPNVPVYVGKVERVGVFVDYDEGQVSFYDAQAATPIFSFTDCLFTEELYPYFNPCDNEYGSNLEPMTIAPARRMA